MARRTPQEKKELDYKRQRRTNWDNDKAARKAIPAAKARKNRTIRRDSKLTIRTEAIEELTIGSMRSIDRTAPGDKYGRGETLGNHVLKQKERRSESAMLPFVSDSWNLIALRRHCDAKYSKRKHYRKLHDLFLSCERLFTPRSLRKPWLRRDLETLLQLADSTLLREFLSAEPRWKRELKVWRRRATAAAEATT
jgi:hypothetical protein